MTLQDYVQKKREADSRRDRTVGIVLGHVAEWYKPMLGAVAVVVVVWFLLGPGRSEETLSADAYSKADLLYMSSQYEEAVKAFGTALTEGGLDDERIRSAYTKLAISLEKTNRLDDAIKTYQELIKRYPRSEEANHAQADVERIKLHHNLN